MNNNKPAGVNSEGVIKWSDIAGKGYNSFANTKAFYRVVKGSRMSKKSKTIALLLLIKMITYKWCNILVVRRYKNTNKKSTFSDFQWAINRLGQRHNFKVNKADMNIEYIPHGTFIYFEGLDDPMKLTSISVINGALSDAWFEEAFQIESEDKFDMVVDSIRGSIDDPTYFKQITVSFNPWSDRHWLKAKFFDEDTRVDNVYSITTTWRCNEFIDTTDRNRMKDILKRNPRKALVVSEGEWGISEGLIFEDNFDMVDFEPKLHLPIVRGLDFGRGGPDPAAYIAYYLDLRNKEIWVFDEYKKSKVSIAQLYHEVFEKRKIGKATVRADHEPYWIHELNLRGGNVISATKGKDSIKYGIKYLQDFKIHIHPSCTNFFEEISTYEWAKDALGDTTEKPKDIKGDHLLDAFRYAVSPLYMKKDEPKKKTTTKKATPKKALSKIKR